MSKAFLTEGGDWDFCAEKGVSCVYAIAGMGACRECRNVAVLEWEEAQKKQQQEAAKETRFCAQK